MDIIKPELLAPAGGKPHLIAAVNNGADAVYMGGMSFNARIFADNFSDEELPDAVRYAHAHGVKVYMTINTLIRDDELSRALEYCNYIYGIGADGVIIQDMGLARLLRKYLPDLPLHLSTQGTLYNPEALETASKLGFTRVVPARETSLKEIKEIAKGCEALDRPMDVEVFVHGAMCMCYSGQCQMSRMLGGGSGRSGNRGTCAQPCRHAYTDDSGRTYYALSPKDLCLIERIPELTESGAASFKIEGRIKSPEYVAIVTRTYRKYIDLYCGLRREHGAAEASRLYSVDEKDMLDLKQIFNRGEFTEGYLHGDPGEDILSGASPKNQGLYLGRVVAVIDNESKLSERDEKSAARGALRRGRELVCIRTDRSAEELSIVLRQGDGLEFRAEEREYLVNPPVGGVTTYVKDLGNGMVLAGDFERGVHNGDSVFRVTDHELMENAMNAPEKKLPVTASFTARKGQFPVLAMTDVRLGRSIEITADHVVEEARKAPTDADRIESNLSRLGDTPYTAGLSGIDVEIDGDIMMPVSIINRMRREASEELLKARLDAVTAGRRPKLSKEDLEQIKSDEALGTECLDAEAFISEISERKRRPIPLERYMECIREGKALPEGALPYILNVSKGSLDKFIAESFDEIAEACRDTGILIGNLGWIDRFTKAGIRVYGDYGLNVYNLQSLRAFEELGVELYLPSHETGVCDERGISLMITEHAVGSMTLTDRKGAVHEVKKAASGDKTLIF